MGAAIASPTGIAEAREARRRIDLAAAALPDALAELSRQTANSFGTEGALPEFRTPEVRGDMTVAEALMRLLAHSDYEARQVGATVWRIVRRRAPPSHSSANAGPALPATPEPAVPIVVTAAKRQQPLADLPMAVSVVRPQQYRPFDPTAGTSWLSQEVDGLVLTNLGTGRNRMFIRGVVDSPFNGESQSTVAVVLDDARVTYAAPDPDLRLVDIDRVEVLKGPQGALYGTGAIGGIYHIVTNRPNVDETSLVMSVGGEAVAHGGIGYSGSAVANLPLRPGTAALRLIGYSASEPGWVDTGDRHDANTSRVVGARVGLGVNVASDWRLDLTGFGQWLNSRDSQYVYVAGSRSRPAQLPEPHDNDLRHLSARLTGRAGDIELSLASGSTWHEVGDTIDATLGADGLGLPSSTLLIDDRFYRVWDNEVRVAGHSGTAVWLIGLSHLTASQHRAVTLEGALASSSIVDAERRSLSDTAAFGEVTVPLSETIKLSAGGRLYHSVFSQSGTFLGLATVDERRRDGVTPSAALSWSPSAGRLLFVRYGSAFRQGVVGIDAMGSPSALPNDELATLEAGWREELRGGSRVELGAFFTWWDNLQSDVLRADGLIGTQTAGNARIAGIEASFDGPIAPGWTVTSGASIIRSQLVRNALGYEVDDKSLPVVPEYTLRSAIEHIFRLNGHAATVRLQVRYLGPAHLSFDPALDRPMGKVLESSLQGRVDIGLSSISAEVTNLFGNSANTFSFGNPLRFSIGNEMTPQKPTTVSVSFTKKF